MILVGRYNYMILESPDDYSNVIWEEKTQIRIRDYGVIEHNGDMTNYPQYYKYLDSHDPRSCGSWRKCSKEEVKQAILDCIKSLSIQIKKYEHILKNLQE